MLPCERGTDVKLLLMRHGPAENPDNWQGEDAARPLTESGRNMVEWVAAQLDSLTLDLEEVCTSPLLRARQTAELLVGAFGTELVPLTEDERLARDLGLTELREVLDDRPGARRLLLVGHEPYLSALVTSLTGGKVVLEPAGLARIHLDEREMTGALEWLASPRLLGAVEGSD